jgi:flagellar basal-body rod protein FlgB
VLVQEGEKKAENEGERTDRMIVSGAFGKNMEMLSREMEVATMRRNIIANNVANANTPNFKRSELNFESSLKRALDSEKAVQPFPQYLTDPKHIAFNKPTDWRQVRPRQVLDYLTESKNNGNNVDIEQEGMDALNNQLIYTTLAQVISSEFQRVNIVLR